MHLPKWLNGCRSSAIINTLQLASMWLIAMGILAIVAISPVYPRDIDGKYANSPLRDWVNKLKSKSGVLCCSVADGFPAEAENDTANGHWRVRIEGKWWVVPDHAVIDDQPNKLGFPMVWWYPTNEEDGSITPVIRCFMPGALL